MNQIELIHNRDWDILLVIDALRYDYFEKYYELFFKNKGILIKTKSVSTYTVGWLIEIFKNKMENVILISSEPIAERINDIDKRLKHGGTYNIKDYFDNIVEVWKYAYDEKNNVVLPNFMTETTEKTIKENPGKRIICKYWQVHDPYIYWMERGIKNVSPNLYVKGNLRKLLYELISDETYWTIIKKFGYPPENWLGAVWLEHGREGIIKGYTEDMFFILKQVKNLIDKFPDKKFVITTDHGERLGEGGRYSHGGRRTKEIKEIPWFEINPRMKE